MKEENKEEKTAIILGHCKFDGPQLASAAEEAGAQAIRLDTSKQLLEYLEEGKPADVILVNRIFVHDKEQGIEVIKKIHQDYPNVKCMLVSNHEDAQSQAQQAGAIPGFGKQLLGTPDMIKKIQEALQS